MEELMEFMRGLDWSPLLISLKTGVVATILSFFGGIFAARQIIKAGPKTKAVLDGILTLPMVLPPTVAGFFLLLIFSLRRPFGAALYEGELQRGNRWACGYPAARRRRHAFVLHHRRGEGRPRRVQGEAGARLHSVP